MGDQKAQHIFPPHIYPQTSRKEKGARELNRTTHYDSCNGTECPCYKEGRLDESDPIIAAIRNLKDRAPLAVRVAVLESALKDIYNMDYKNEAYKMHKKAKEMVDP